MAHRTTGTTNNGRRPKYPFRTKTTSVLLNSHSVRPPRSRQQGRENGPTHKCSWPKNTLCSPDLNQEPLLQHLGFPSALRALLKLPLKLRGTRDEVERSRRSSAGDLSIGAATQCGIHIGKICVIECHCGTRKMCTKTSQAIEFLVKLCNQLH